MYTPREPLTQEQVLALLKAATRSKHAKRDLALLSLLLGTGMRINEVAALALQDIHRKSTDWYAQCRKLKNDVPRWVPLSPPVFQALLSYLALYPMLRSVETPEADKLFQLPDKPQILLFGNQSGGALSPEAIGYIVSKLAVETGVISPAGGIAGRLRLTFIEAYWAHNPGDVDRLFLILGQRRPRSFSFLHVLLNGKDLRSIHPHKLGFIDDWYSQLAETEE
jgi:integrase